MDDDGFLLDPFQFTPASIHILDGQREFFSAVLEENQAYQQFWINLTNTDSGWSWGKVFNKLSRLWWNCLIDIAVICTVRK